MNMPSGKTRWLALGAFLALILTGWTLMRSSGDAEAQMPTGPQGPIPVNVAVLQQKEVRIWKEFAGRLTAVDSAHIRPQVSGRITEIHFQDGQRVEEGDLLFVIDPRPYEAALQQAKAVLQAAQSGYKRADNDFKRAEELIQTDAISGRVYDERRSARNLVLAEINGAKAEVEKAQINLDYAHVKAPISGRIGRAELTVGNLVEAGPGAPLVTEIVADEKIYVDFEVDEQTYLSHIREQAKDREQESMIPVQVVLRSDEDYVIDGVIKAFDNRINPTSGTIRARAILDNADGAMLPGMFANVRLGSAEREQQILVPEKAIGTDQDRKFVYVVDDKKQIAYRQIKMGDRIGADRVALEGLQPGDQVIVDSILMLRPGTPVEPKVIEEAAAPEQTEAEMPPPATDEPVEEVEQSAEPLIEPTPEPMPEPEQEVAPDPALTINPQPLLPSEEMEQGGQDE